MSQMVHAVYVAQTMQHRCTVYTQLTREYVMPYIFKFQSTKLTCSHVNGIMTNMPSYTDCGFGALPLQAE